MKNTFIISLLFVLILFSCSKDSTENISPEAKSFLTEVLDIMEAYFIRKDQVDWKDMRDKVFETVSNAKTIDDTYPGIKKALILLNESHSYFIKPNGEYLFGVTKSCVAEKATTPIAVSYTH